MHGGGFGGPDWSVRVSLANLAEETYPKIGQYLREAAQGYVEEWRQTQKGIISKHSNHRTNK
jgi:aspartate 4-decarboxylase